MVNPIPRKYRVSIADTNASAILLTDTTKKSFSCLYEKVGGYKGKEPFDTDHILGCFHV